MDNFLENEIEKDEQEEKEPFAQENEITKNINEGADIEFDEKIDIDEIQRALKRQLNEEIDEDDFIDEKTPEELILEENLKDSENTEVNNLVIESTSSALPVIKPEIDSKSKKYVIYIDPENVEFMENLSINERKIIINKILREQDEFIQQQIIKEDRRRYFLHAMTVLFTILIGFPLTFFLVNLSMNTTIENYQQAQKNFSTLYREQGKIKQINPMSR